MTVIPLSNLYACYLFLCCGRLLLLQNYAQEEVLLDNKLITWCLLIFHIQIGFCIGSVTLLDIFTSKNWYTRGMTKSKKILSRMACRSILSFRGLKVKDPFENGLSNQISTFTDRKWKIPLKYASRVKFQLSHIESKKYFWYQSEKVLPNSKW